jgi:hypothetical protein
MSPTPPFLPADIEGKLEDHGRHIRLTADFVFEDNGQRVMVPKDFGSDFNSVPRGLWNLFPPWEYPEAGIVHDWLYQKPQSYYIRLDQTWSPASVPMTRKEVDNIHRRILQLTGAGWMHRQLMWLGIRSGGWLPWKKLRKKDANHTSSH